MLLDISRIDTISLERRGDRLKTTEPLTDSMFYIMAALTKPRHGYAIMILIEETTTGAITIGPASMYTIIKKLLKQEWIYLYDGSDSRRKTYLLTKRGIEVLEEAVKIRKTVIQLAEKGLQEAGE
ncbi:PadR family transcriptional regulator [Shouchella clausii KSM-K16]|uniref:PadR family transcriptional regulator n=1 Tax=Shouchella clausii (strain KSM-K16) TaxID=66692 RepID=Q5WLJ9_SHOC1|nr:PadR family transcriptional regulator [Shouchella clausii KSM-K16]